MFDTEYEFEELPILIGATEIAMCTAQPCLKESRGRTTTASP